MLWMTREHPGSRMQGHRPGKAWSSVSQQMVVVLFSGWQLRRLHLPALTHHLQSAPEPILTLSLFRAVDGPWSDYKINNTKPYGVWYHVLIDASDVFCSRHCTMRVEAAPDKWTLWAKALFVLLSSIRLEPMWPDWMESLLLDTAQKGPVYLKRSGLASLVQLLFAVSMKGGVNLLMLGQVCHVKD